MSGHKQLNAVGTLRSRFHVPTYIGLIIDDLAEELGESAAVLREQRHSPSALKQVVDRLLSDADCMDNVGYYAALRQVQACFSKLAGWGTVNAKERKDLAIQKFIATDQRMRIVNKRLAFYQRHPSRLMRKGMVGKVLNEAITDCHKALGVVPDFDVLFEASGFGPGLTFGLSGADQRNLMYKIDGDQTVTNHWFKDSLSVLRQIFPNWHDHLVKSGKGLTRVAGNRITTVPKTAEIDRTIGIEPSLNVFCQKGVDVYMRQRLRLMGLKLNSQEYSIECMREFGLDISTIDLSAASDSVSIELVRMFVPSDWFQLLDMLRSKEYTLDRGLTFHKYHKFSSMGNATTFPLESMIFMAVARACCRVAGYSNYLRDRVRVYGDDIIVPWQIAGLVIETLRFLGFRTNSDKTFVFGSFRETCGVDLLHGVDVRPVYLRAIPTKAWEVAGLYNRLLTNRFGFHLERVLSYLISLPEKVLYGPAYFGYASTNLRDLERGSWVEWYAGKNSEGDAYFFAPHAHHHAVQVTRGDTTTSWYVLKRWMIVRRALKGDWSESARYMAFLLGVEGGRPLDSKPVYKLVEAVYTAPFPALDRPWPDVYEDPRPPSERILRRVAGEEVGR